MAKNFIRKVTNAITKVAAGTAENKSKVLASKAALKKAKGEYLLNKGKYLKDKGWKGVTKHAAATAMQSKAEEERTKRALSEHRAQVHKAAISKWNGIVNQNATAAEGTGLAQGGNLGITVVGNE